MNPFYTKIIGKELYVYYNGSLLYKRWLDKNYGAVFCPIFGTFYPSKDKL